MTEVKILFRHLNIKNREGYEKSLTFSILNIIVSETDARIINSSLPFGFVVTVIDYKIIPYTGEAAGIITIDLPLFLTEHTGCYKLEAKNQAATL